MRPAGLPLVTKRFCSPRFPKQAPKAVDRGLLIQRANRDLVLVVRNTPGRRSPLSQVLSPDCQKLTFTAHADKVTGEFVGLKNGPTATSRAVRFVASAAATTSVPRSWVCSPDLAGRSPPELRGHDRHPLHQHPDGDQDDRNGPGRPAYCGLLIALHVLDTADGVRHRRFLPARWWSLSPLDGLVIAVLVWWHFVGANTSDDGYILTMARVSEHAGYMANYPMVRHSGGAVRLVLRPACVVVACDDSQHLDATAHPADGVGVLVDHQPGGDSPPQGTR